MEKKEQVINGIKAWPESERPRERLWREGPQALSDAELVALLLRSGVRGEDAVSFSRNLLVRFQGVRGLLNAGPAELKKISGLGPAKIASLMAGVEIGKRGLREEISGKNILRDPESVFTYVKGSLGGKQKEVFKVLFLNKANRIVAEEDLFEGTVDQTAVHPREILKAALEFSATAIILVHNHPSGRIEPSAEDREMTRKIQSLCEALNIQVLDHIVVGGSRYFSFKEHGLV